MRTLILSMLCAAWLLAGPAAAKDRRVWAAAERLRGEQLGLLQQIVDTDSGTGDVEGGRKVGLILAERLKALGIDVQLIPAEAPGLPENLVATMRGSGKGRVLIVGHLDTVFAPGAAAARPYRTDASRAYGPGVGDEKGGVVAGVFALRILKELRFRDFDRITYLIESSEERGSPGTRALIDRLLKEADAELNLEPGQPPDSVTVWRKGSSSFHIEVKGRAAHAGVNPQDGVNAATELLNQLRGVEALPRSGEGLTANLTMLNAGTRHNIIPDQASATLNVRVRERADMDRVGELLERNARATLVPGARVTVRAEGAYPPLPDNPATRALAARAQAIYAAAGLTLGAGGSGGASESALAAEAGVPALDGLGPVGGGFHADGEYIELGSITPRLYLLTKLLMDLGARPPARPKPAYR